MIKYFILSILYFYPANSDETKLCNIHQFSQFFVKIYDLKLCIEDKQFLYPEEIFKSDFSLTINYNLKFTKYELTESSLTEMNRYYILDQNRQNQYYNKLLEIFPDVAKDDVIEAKYKKENILEFYYNDKFIGKIEEKVFVHQFLDIWLHKDNKYKKMRRDLFKK